MKYHIAIAVSLLVLIQTASADITKDLIGTWSLASVFKNGAQKEVSKSPMTFSKRKNGIIHAISRERINGRMRKTAEFWYYPNFKSPQ